MTREEALATLEEGWSRLQHLLSRLDDEQAQRPATIGGGDWSARDLVVHLAYWDELAVEAAEEWRAGREPAVERVFRERAVDRVNAENQQRSLAQSPDDVRARASRAHAAIVQLVAGLSDEQWSGRAPYRTERRETLGVLLGSILGAPRRGFGHTLAHLPDLEAYVAGIEAPVE